MRIPAIRVHHGEAHVLIADVFVLVTQERDELSVRRDDRSMVGTYLVRELRQARVRRINTINAQGHRGMPPPVLGLVMPILVPIARKVDPMTVRRPGERTRITEVSGGQFPRGTASLHGHYIEMPE